MMTEWRLPPEKKAGARRPRLSSWLCARIKPEEACGDGRPRPSVHRITHRALTILVTRSVAPAPSSRAPAPECSTSAFRSAATDTALLRPRTDLPSTRALPPAGSVLHRRADPAH